MDNNEYYKLMQEHHKNQKKEEAKEDALNFAIMKHIKNNTIVINKILPNDAINKLKDTLTEIGIEIEEDNYSNNVLTIIYK